MSEEQTTDQFRAEMRGLFTTMSGNIATMAHDMSSLKTAVVGEPLLGTTGLVTRMSENEKAVATQKDTFEKDLQTIRDKQTENRAWVEKKLAWVSGVGAVGGMIFAIVLALIEGGHFFGQH